MHPGIINHLTQVPPSHDWAHGRCSPDTSWTAWEKELLRWNKNSFIHISLSIQIREILVTFIFFNYISVEVAPYVGVCAVLSSSRLSHGIKCCWRTFLLIVVLFVEIKLVWKDGIRAWLIYLYQRGNCPICIDVKGFFSKRLECRNKDACNNIIKKV